MRERAMHKTKRFSLLVGLLCLVIGASACRLFSREVACRRDRDCPRDAGMPFCTSFDADAGFCTDDEEFRGDFPPPDAGDATQADSGVAGADAADLSGND
jgi:hypothetical protein